MKKNILKVRIARSVEDVFNFTTDSSKISLWFDSIAEEIPSETPLKRGTTLKNRAPDSKKWNEYEVAEFAPNEVFALSQIGGDYHVRYIYIPSSDGTELTYEEWSDSGELSDVELQSTLEKLKSVLENETSERSDV